MRERVPCEFFLIRYVPDVVKGEFVNIGVLLREAAADAAAEVRFTRDWTRVRCMDADADVALLEGLEQEIGLRLRQGTSAREPKTVLEVLADTLSNSVQMTDARATLAENLPTEMDQLMRMYVEPMKIARVRQRSGRAAIQAAVRGSFERAGVWPSMRKRISAAAYTRAGDPLQLDCGYRAQRHDEGKDALVRMFQAVSLEGDVEAAKGLAFSARALREGVARVEGAKLKLTAVVEPLRQVSEFEDEASERYLFGVETMEREAIRVITLSDLARAAETAKWELGF